MKVAASFLTVASAASVSGELRIWLASLFVPAKLGSNGRKIQHEEEELVQSGSDCDECLRALPPDVLCMVERSILLLIGVCMGLNWTRYEQDQ